MDVHQLELFLAVIEAPSMTQAAERVHLSPGAVSLQLRNLADELRTELFAHRGKRLIPTPAGLRLAEHARAVIRMMSHVKQEFDDDLSKDARPFHFATGVTTLIYQLSRPLRELRKQFPNAEIRITVAMTEEMITGLHDRRFDLALITLPIPEENLKITPLFDEEMLVIRPSTTRVKGGRVGSISVAELAKSPFLFYPKRSNMRFIIDRFFKEIEVTPHVIMEADDTEAIKGLVESGFGYAILPEHALRGHSGFFHKFRVPGHTIKRTLALAAAQSAFPRKLTEAITNSLQAMLVKNSRPA